MIRQLRGTVTSAQEGLCVLDVSGVGYGLRVTPATLAVLLPQAGRNRETTLFTYLVVREDVLELYGFLEEDERALFEKLLSVPGVGPRSALGVLALGDARMLAGAIARGDVEYLSGVAGVGKKSAEKIVLALRDKLGPLALGETETGDDLEVLEALKALGYREGEARQALKQIEDGVTGSQEKIRAALSLLGK